ncbi:ABC transporter substrate-binding protein [Eoetvoesiella caeni]|uniref:Branched-chain amino acid transport system substrate-binding protein n=1 Tax=Eoetvoesiella caeni TaxID=645616 RepID=A0A366HCF4_9BURK|nr:ABC transporter substrate-binding protein [Eoetvoesiella caeni]MCI2809215.1 ABC transporter substrate-binding protein [Eoetvoesiella caeni]NYT54355.1 ABC transporter substrate-binding protein [Eoetvoesiella caeni]RBP39457.1 branched-chain amino acid transport system substrate-binding protein [Eoetvoesiella caeni]
MKSLYFRCLGLSVLAGLIAGAPVAAAQDVVKVGMIVEMSGPFSEFGRQMQAGVKIYQDQFGDSVAGKRVEVVYRDTGGANPDAAKRLAQELVVRDKVQVLAGFGFTPNAMAVAPIATQAKLPMVVMNAAGAGITAKSPYMVRTSFTYSDVVPPIAKWAVEQGAKTAYVIVADYAPGHDAEQAFVKTFEAAGGKVVGAVRTPLVTTEFAPYMLRVKDAKPDVLFAFVNGGSVAPAFIKEFRAKGLGADGIKLLGTGDVVDEPIMNVIGEQGMGMTTVYPYSMHHESALNKEYVQRFKALLGNNERPAIMSVAAYDGMAAIYAALKKTGGNADGTALIAALKGLEIESPRGRIRIDAKTGDIVQDEYIRRFEKVNGEFANVEFKTYKAGN